MTPGSLGRVKEPVTGRHPIKSRGAVTENGAMYFRPSGLSLPHLTCYWCQREALDILPFITKGKKVFPKEDRIEGEESRERVKKLLELRVH